MGDNPYQAPPGNHQQGHLFRLLVRLALILNYPFVAISCLAFLGLTCGGAFVTEFSVENQTSHTIYVTPIGTVGPKGAREALSVCIWTLPTIWSSQRGGFPVPPGESIKIMYDTDDINFSEIVVHDAEGERGQLVVNPEPTRNLYTLLRKRASSSTTSMHSFPSRSTFVALPAARRYPPQRHGPCWLCSASLGLCGLCSLVCIARNAIGSLARPPRATHFDGVPTDVLLNTPAPLAVLAAFTRRTFNKTPVICRTSCRRG